MREIIFSVGLLFIAQFGFSQAQKVPEGLKFPELKVQTIKSPQAIEFEMPELPANVVTTNTRTAPQPRVQANVVQNNSNEDLLVRYEKSLGMMSSSFKAERPDIAMELERLIEMEKIKRSLQKGE